MITLNNISELFLYSAPIDMRKSIDGLSYLVCDLLERNPQDSSVYIFYNRARDKVKLIFWDKNGFVMYYKRLEKGKFKFDKSLDDDTLQISGDQLSWLLAGLDFRLMNEFEHLKYDNYY